MPDRNLYEFIYICMVLTTLHIRKRVNDNCTLNHNHTMNHNRMVITIVRNSTNQFFLCHICMTVQHGREYLLYHNLTSNSPGALNQARWPNKSKQDFKILYLFPQSIYRIDQDHVLWSDILCCHLLSHQVRL